MTGPGSSASLEGMPIVPIPAPLAAKPLSPPPQDPEEAVSHFAREAAEVALREGFHRPNGLLVCWLVGYCSTLGLGPALSAAAVGKAFDLVAAAEQGQ